MADIDKFKDNKNNDNMGSTLVERVGILVVIIQQLNEKVKKLEELECRPHCLQKFLEIKNEINILKKRFDSLEIKVNNDIMGDNKNPKTLTELDVKYSQLFDKIVKFETSYINNTHKKELNEKDQLINQLKSNLLKDNEEENKEKWFRKEKIWGVVIKIIELIVAALVASLLTITQMS